MPSAKRAAYFPRTPWLKSYSGASRPPPGAVAGLGVGVGVVRADRERRLPLELGFFIGSSFGARGEARTDEAERGSAFHMDDHQQALVTAEPDQDEPLLPGTAMVRVGDRDRVGVGEGCGRFLEGHAVAPEVQRRLRGIPTQFEAHRGNLRAPRPPCTA